MNTRDLLGVLGRQDYIRFGVRDRLIRRFHNPDTSSSEEFVIPFFGAKYRGNFDTFLDWSVFYYGAYCREELRLIEEVLEIMPSPVVFDVGANIGHHTLFAALRSKQVFAFEPLPAVAERIDVKLRDNGLENVRVCRFGLGVEDAVATYVPPRGHNTGTGSFADASNGGAETLSLPIKRGDDFVREASIGRIDFIKIDTEGYEPLVLEGLSTTLNAMRPVIFFEWSQNERNNSSLCGPRLFPPNYRFFQFISDTVMFGVFRKASYTLREVTDSWEDGNILALPQEFLKKMETEFASTSLAQRFL